MYSVRLRSALHQILKIADLIEWRGGLFASLAIFLFQNLLASTAKLYELKFIVVAFRMMFGTYTVRRTIFRRNYNTL